MQVNIYVTYSCKEDCRRKGDCCDDYDICTEKIPSQLEFKLCEYFEGGICMKCKQNTIIKDNICVCQAEFDYDETTDNCIKSYTKNFSREIKPFKTDLLGKDGVNMYGNVTISVYNDNVNPIINIKHNQNINSYNNLTDYEYNIHSGNMVLNGRLTPDKEIIHAPTNTEMVNEFENQIEDNNDLNNHSHKTSPHNEKTEEAIKLFDIIKNENKNNKKDEPEESKNLGNKEKTEKTNKIEDEIKLKNKPDIKEIKTEKPKEISKPRNEKMKLETKVKSDPNDNPSGYKIKISKKFNNNSPHSEDLLIHSLMTGGKNFDKEPITTTYKNWIFNDDDNKIIGDDMDYLKVHLLKNNKKVKL